jgi:hypothetical protein
LRKLLLLAALRSLDTDVITVRRCAKIVVMLVEPRLESKVRIRMGTRLVLPLLALPLSAWNRVSPLQESRWSESIS